MIERFIAAVFLSKHADNGTQKKGVFNMNQEEKSRKEMEQAGKTVRQLQAQLDAARKGEKVAARKHENHHKYMMGGVVHKYFRECYEFSEDDMNEIISCAFSHQSIKNLIQKKIDEKKREKNEYRYRAEEQTERRRKTGGINSSEMAKKENNVADEEYTGGSIKLGQDEDD